MFEKKHIRKYKVYGLVIESEIKLPDLITTDAVSEAAIIRGKINEENLEDSLSGARIFERKGFRSRVSPRAVLLEYEGVGKILISGRNKIIVEPEAGTDDADLQPFLTGPAMAVLLQRRDFLVLHAGAVELKGGAAVFLGAKGAGKSTFSAFMQSCGHRLISDDVIPVSFADGKASTFPGFPKIKLYADSIEAVGHNASNFPRIHRRADKYSFHSLQEFSTASLRVKAIYVLTESNEIQIVKSDLKTAFFEVTRHSHLARYAEAMDCRRLHFEQCRKLIESVPVFELKRPFDFKTMNRVGTMLENHVAELTVKSAGRRCETAS